MRPEGIALRYVKAFLEVSGFLEEKTAEYENQLRLLERLFVQKISSDFFLSPVVTLDKKKEVLHLFLSEVSADDVMKHFLLATLEANRVEVFPCLYRVYREELQRQLEIVPIRIISSFPLTEKEKEEAARVIKEGVPQKSELQFECNEDILGGVVVFVGHVKIDLSLHNRITQVINSVRA
jgi:F-type H+-transporting ATPase subunit delta